MAVNFISGFLRIQKTKLLCTCLRDVRQYHLINTKGRWKVCSYQGVKVPGVVIPMQVIVREIRVTEPRPLHPFFVLVFRPLSRGLAVITGTIFKMWWRRLTPEKKEKIMNNLRSKQKTILGFIAGTIVVTQVYYYTHLYVNPITGQRRFLMISEELMEKLAYYAYQGMVAPHDKKMVPRYHPLHRRTERVLKTLIDSNYDLPNVDRGKWSVIVIDEPGIVNAAALPNGHIVVFSGLLNFCSNDHQLAVALSHELAHVIMSHMRESISVKLLIDALLFIPSVIYWFALGSGGAFFSDVFTKSVAEILFSLPYHRSVEMEADVAGLFMAARACFDVAEALIFWRKMELIPTTEIPEFLSSHPSNENRIKTMASLKDAAIEVQRQRNCPVFFRRPYMFYF